MTVFCDPTAFPVPEDWRELAKKCRVYCASGNRLQTLWCADGLDNAPADAAYLASKSYCWDSEPRKANDEADRRMLSKETRPEPTQVFMFHTYSGYYGFFRPDLLEIIRVAAEFIRAAPTCVFLETHPCTAQGVVSYTGTECFDKSRDLHRGVTFAWAV